MREVYFINGKVIDLSINNKIKEKYKRLKNVKNKCPTIIR
jgi:hypothetical protein